MKKFFPILFPLIALQAATQAQVANQHHRAITTGKYHAGSKQH